VEPAILVLIVEDDTLIQEVLVDALEAGGFKASIAQSGRQAIGMLAATGTDYQALITDVDLGDDVSGWDVARHAREINDMLPVIYMTGGDAHDWASKGVPNSLLLVKPFAPAQVVTGLSQLLNAVAGKAS
jgi:DNA-binding response OmpR family regulator